LLFTGDINPGRCPAQISIANNDFTLPYQAIGPDLRLADLTVGSLDGSISDLSPPSPCPQTMNLIGPARVVEGLSFAGFDVITVATNHAKDCGRLGFGCDHRAFLDTLQHLRAGGIWPVGGGGNLAEARAPVSLTARGTRFAFLGVNEIAAGTWATADEPGTAPLSAETLAAVLADIRAAAQQAEVVIVLAQWGVEYTDFPADYQRAWAAQMITAGATLVIGNHPHLIQPIEEITRPDGAVGVVAYALGNFIFDQGPWRTRQGLVFEATFAGAQLQGWRARPTHIHSLYLVKWAEATEAAQILERLEAANAKLRAP
jgi:poly-gamma-glutamate synthesis protein (capsule biosynthesis protein)